MAGCSSNNLTVQVGPQGVQGDAARYAVLTCDAFVLPSNLAGTVSDYTGCSTIFRFFIGNVEQDLAYTSIVTSPATDATPTTGFAYTVADESGGYGVQITVTAMGTTPNLKTLTISYTYQGVTYTKKFSVAKARSAS